MNSPSQVPAGVLALVGESVRRQRDTERRCLELLESEGFQEVVLPVLEFAPADSTAEGYRFVDGAGRLVALRTDFTPLAARVLASSLGVSDLPLHVAYAGEVVRPRPTRLRQLPELYQLGFESYGVASGGRRALEVTLALLARAGVGAGRLHLAVGVAGLAEEILAQLLEEPADDELLELLRVRDLDALADLLGVGASRLAALSAAAFGEPPERWAEALGVATEVARCRPLLEVASGAGIAATIDVAPRLTGAYYHGVVFTLYGKRTRAALAGGGEYEVELASGRVPAAGACLALGVALDEAGESER